MAKILIIDDSSLSRRILRRMLEASGHVVTEATDGLSGLEHYYLDQPDLVLLDMTMHGMHGLDVLAQLRQMTPPAAVIVATADIQSSTRVLAGAEGAYGFLTKPFTEQEVREAVNAAISRKADDD